MHKEIQISPVFTQIQHQAEAHTAEWICCHFNHRQLIIRKKSRLWQFI